jgi:hypothetical protein
MNRAFIVRRIAIAALFAFCLVVVAVPWALYWLGLHGAGGTPEPPSTLASVQVRLAAWERLRGTGAPNVERLNPYTFWTLVLVDGPRPPGAMAAWQVARNHVAQHQPYRGMLWWHLSGASVTIWLTRNWSIEQLLTKAAEQSAG